jgi:hypothetical protein
MADAHTHARDANTISDSDKGARFAAELKLRARTHASGRARGSPGCRPAPPLGLHRPAASLERYGCCTAPVRCSRPSASEHSKKHSIHAECWAQGHFRRKSLEAPETSVEPRGGRLLLLLLLCRGAAATPGREGPGRWSRHHRREAAPMRLRWTERPDPRSLLRAAIGSDPPTGVLRQTPNWMPRRGAAVPAPGRCGRGARRRLLCMRRRLQRSPTAPSRTTRPPRARRRPSTRASGQRTLRKS